MAGTRSQEMADDEQDLTAPGSPAWWAARHGRAEPERRVPITLSRIVSAALELIDREGARGAEHAEPGHGAADRHHDAVPVRGRQGRGAGAGRRPRARGNT